jgi:hypothetical protein
MDDQDALSVNIDRRALASRALSYSERCEQWLEGSKDEDPVDAADPLTVVRRFAPFIPLQIRDGNAEVAMLAIEHSRMAWLALVKHKAIRPLLAEPFVSDLVWLKHEVERVFPHARGAVRNRSHSLDRFGPVPTM